ncbi:hypothetical protein ACRE_075360 [Hapsidospora chrysogenum ATCC 11550]|uniref:RlpA-like protein double-psi beta-barrel domain-containing protein n=1 Tax=Hapsidospora chrysogenum (strain ATCC 11550 / CBS 779.69 / DSM 880 / IAM 14645 / JCM 23072 / IMI 49137) TaxID=857340 RepID=A0A086SXB9_HAPC1|nr:hypothetical protein ACRE_075360 [Hapsidospora chrysogenum ATCC 11550]
MMPITLAQLLALATAVMAAPSSQERAAGHRGSVTYYHPGLGACEQVHGDRDMVGAVSKLRFDVSRPCGKRVRVRGPAGQATITIVDRCDGCAHDDLDLSPAAFRQAIGDLGIGNTQAEWEWV